MSQRYPVIGVRVLDCIQDGHVAVERPRIAG